MIEGFLWREKFICEFLRDVAPFMGRLVLAFILGACLGYLGRS